ncbi:MAG: ChbG/HpnK family deacetylase [Candidatus Moraniibacteriota bacterium]|nr:MAG: ChbG/HpnK family deacetylase [Candidatus Moranbacteria bacterium]
MDVFSKKICISADDFGMCRLGNDRTLFLLEQKKIHRISCLVYGEYNEDDIQRLVASNAKLDIHLDTETEVKQEGSGRGSVARRGLYFLYEFWFTKKYLSKKMEQEWEKQILLFYKKFGKYPDGLNTHQHIHYFFPFFRVLIRLSKKYSISYIRLGKNSFYVPDAVAIILDILRIFDITLLKRSKKQTSDVLLSFDWFRQGNFLTIETLYSRLQGRNIEIIFHPKREEDFVFLSEKNNF